MTKRTKILMIIALLLIVIGGVIFVGAMSMIKWDFKKLSTERYENNIYNVTEEFKNLTIETGTSQIKVIKSQSEKVTVECFENKKIKHTVSVDNDTLTIKIDDNRKWYEMIGVNFHSPTITISIPSGEYGNLKIKASTGSIETAKELTFNDINITATTGSIKCNSSARGNVELKASTGDILAENIFAKDLYMSVSTGKISAKNIQASGDIKIKVSTGKAVVSETTCKNLYSNGSTGDIKLNRVIAIEKVSIERDTGDIQFESCDASELFFKTSTGDVGGSLLTSKVFIYHTDTGEVDIPKTTTGGVCEINTDTGDIEITIMA